MNKLEKINKMLEQYYESEDSFEQTELAIEIIQGHVDWLINRVEELEKQRNERTHLLNAEVARNVRYEKVLKKIVNHAGTNKEIDYELWKMAKEALEGEK